MDNMVKQVDQVVIQGMKTMLEELYLKPFLIDYFVGIHHTNSVEDIWV
jgi:hypothetical protein